MQTDTIVPAFSDMALPFEAQPMEERLQDRAKRARNRETWHRVTDRDKLTYNMGAFIANEKDAMEDAIVALIIHRKRSVPSEFCVCYLALLNST